MSSKVFIRPAKQTEGQMYFDWANENPVNEFDSEVAKFPSSFTWCAYDKDGPLAFQTVQQPLMLESLAIRPGATKLQAANVLREFTQNAVTQAHLKGIGEIYYLGSDSDTDDFSVNNIFEQLPFKIFRVKLSDLEG